MNTFKEFFESFVDEQQQTSVGFFPGCFSPPHKGHYMTAKQMSEENTNCYIIASDSCRDPNITVEKMVAIWKIYLEAMQKPNIEIKVVSGSPVAVTYQAVNLLNNSGKLVSDKQIDVHSDAQDIYNKSKSKQLQVSLYAGAEDLKGRYSAFFKDGVLYKGSHVTDVMARPVARYASGTETRGAIHDIAIGIKDADTLRNLLPGPGAGAEFNGPGFLSPDQEDQVINILLN